MTVANENQGCSDTPADGVRPSSTLGLLASELPNVQELNVHARQTPDCHGAMDRGNVPNPRNNQQLLIWSRRQAADQQVYIRLYAQKHAKIDRASTRRR